MATNKPKNKALNKAVDRLVDAVMSHVEDGYDNPLLPFGAYVEKTKLEVQDDIKAFRMRMRKGYIAILQAIRDKKDISEDDKKKLIHNLLSQQINTLHGDFRIMP